MAAFNGYARARLGWGNAVRGVSGYAVTGNYFELLGVQPEVGRFFQATDEHGSEFSALCGVEQRSMAKRI